eukprot:2373381-Alexandrium_andersonii.AAC.1
MNVDGPTAHSLQAEGELAEADEPVEAGESGEFGVRDLIDDTQGAELAGELPAPLAAFLPGGPA